MTILRALQQVSNRKKKIQRTKLGREKKDYK